MQSVDEKNTETVAAVPNTPPKMAVDANEVILITSDNCLSIADRHLLMANSEFFRMHFTGPNGNDVAIKFNNITIETLDTLLDFYYQRTIDVNTSNVVRIFEAANYLRFTEIIDGCANLFMNNLNMDSVWSCIDIGDAFKLTRMIDVTHKFVIANFPRIVQRNEYVHLKVNQLIGILRDDHLNVRNEMDVFHAMMKWLMHSYATRIQFVPDLLLTIRLTQLDTEFLATNVAYLARKVFCMPLIQKTINLKRGEPFQRHEWPTLFNPNPRYATINRNHQFGSSGPIDTSPSSSLPSSPSLASSPSVTFVDPYRPSRSQMLAL